MPSDRGVVIIHWVPGRVRLAVPALRRDPARAEEIAELARACPSVVDARASAWAASLTIEHEPDVPLEDVFSELAHIPELSGCSCRPIDELTPSPCAQPIEPPSPGRTARFVVQAADRLNAASQAVPPAHVDLKLLLPALLVGSGLLQVLTRRSPGMPHWITLVKYGVDFFVVLNHGRIQSFFASVGASGSASVGAPTGGEAG
ncbi:MULTISPECIES: hypothetical protein [Sorangium]|uniref:Heavy metal translocating P-type ATPase n=1 Tax=Sorangium atrum TaxID=2995308 RepID=A0ABT5C8M4_9BACT|nr:hypothetical protein [Sorangium aterium]MDC0682781.1 hypothetical protein [Sorangium aterium]